MRHLGCVGLFDLEIAPGGIDSNTSDVDVPVAGTLIHQTDQLRRGYAVPLA